MTVLCFDISSGGISAVLFNPKLEALRRADTQWQFLPDESGAATLSIETIVQRFKSAILDLSVREPLDAIGIGCFMHNCVLLDSGDKPLTPVFTWLDQRGEDGVTTIRSRLGDRFHERTGCRYHPMFPVFKLAALNLRDRALVSGAKRVVSAKSFLIYCLTGVWMEDYGMASSSGLYNLIDSDWDPQLLALAGLKPEQLPPVASRNHAVGRVTANASAEFGLAQDTVVINGSGDGFFASLGSDGETPSRISVTLGTSAVARQALPKPVLDASSGTFCYKAGENQFLLGCAGNNGGNVLDWGRSIFGDVSGETSKDLPIFIPLLYGERSPDWNPLLTGSWYGLTAHHTAVELARSVMEGVIFNLHWFIEIIQEASGQSASEIVLSGNGFLDSAAAHTLASIASIPVLTPQDPGMASLRGAAICALETLGFEIPPLQAEKVSPLSDSRITARYQQYKELRRRI